MGEYEAIFGAVPEGYACLDQWLSPALFDKIVEAGAAMRRGDGAKLAELAREILDLGASDMLSTELGEEARELFVKHGLPAALDAKAEALGAYN